MKILQIGLGGFGKNHLKAWSELGLSKDLYVADLNEGLLEQCNKFGIPKDNRTKNYKDFFGKADVVDIVTPTGSHFPLAKEALEAEKDVFIEKPMTENTADAKGLDQLVKKSGKILQIGYYYRFHPISDWVKNAIQSGKLGTIRYISGRFMGFKRPRMDVGVTHTDAIHFIDLFNYFLDSFPTEVYGIIKDHFNRGMEDFSIATFKYPNGAAVKIESGYIQPGQWKDKVVPNAWTNKDFFICGDKATIEVDFESEKVSFHQVKHEQVDGLWKVNSQGSSNPNIPAASPIDQIKAELTAFMESRKSKATPSANVFNSGVKLAQIMEGFYESAKSNRPVDLKEQETAGVN